MIKDIQLTDGFVHLRPYQVEDTDKLDAALVESKAELMPYMAWMHDDYSFDEIKAWVSQCPDKWEKGVEYNFAIVDAKTGQYLGGCGFNGIDPQFRFANLGYWVRTGSTRRGVATASARLLVRFGISDLNLKRITFAIASPNNASQRVAEKSGATREGVLRNAMFVRDIMYDLVLFSIIPQDLSLSA